MFDIIKFYEDHNLPYSLEGNNVMDGWANINCPFCDDPSNHMGAYIKHPKKARCWRCGEHELQELLSEFSDKDVKTLFKTYSTGELEEPIIQTKIEKPEIPLLEVLHSFLKNSLGIIPFDNKEFNEQFVFPYIKYLIKRNFNPREIQRDWKISPGIESGDFAYRLMIPVYHDNEMVSFQGRDITGKQKDKYKTCPGTKIHNYLYGLDYVTGNRVIVTEGVMDAWRLGKGNAVATFGIKYSLRQVKLIIEKGIEHVIVFFDSEPQAQTAARELIADLELVDIQCTNFTIPGRDPADLTEEEVNNIILPLLR